VIASGGALGGYAWGVELKRFLLDLEKSRRGG
jgi:O6-methylguanine-DNA--protein-cysteine methyltransferase